MTRNICSGDAESNDCFNRLLDSRHRGLILMYASPKNTKLILDYFEFQGNHRQREIFKTISRRFREKKAMLKDLSRFVIITNLTKQDSKLRRRTIYVSPFCLNRTNLLYPPILLGENLTDCELYVNSIAQFYTEISYSLRELKLFQRFEPGGGGNTSASYKRHKNLKLDLCLCIVDSDKSCPEERPGDTAKSVLDVDNKNISPYCKSLLIDAYSAENLLPIDEIYRQYCVGKSEQQISQFEIAKDIRKVSSWKYLPLKKGIRGKDLKSNNAKANFWKKELKNFGITTDCCASDDCDCIIIPGISEKTLARSIEEDNLSWRRKMNLEENYDVKENYIKISREIRSWLCVGVPLRS